MSTTTFVDRVKTPGVEKYSSAERIGELLKEEFKKDPRFYLFSPDETTSNKLTAVYDVESRAWAMPQASWDLPEAENGRIVELLSENTLFAAMLGHILNCENAMLTSYEAFFPIITSQIIQHCKFLAQSESVPFRPKYPAVNLLSTSTCWRQDHNGFTHQSPALISALLARPDDKVNCLFPVDDVAATEAFRFMLQSRDVVNLTTFNKTAEPRWIDSHHAEFQFDNGGASIFEFASEKPAKTASANAAKDHPDYIFTAAGDIATRESLEAIKILSQDFPDLTFRFVGIAALSHNAIGTVDNKLSQKTFDQYFEKDIPIILNFHGYADTLKNIFINYTDKSRLTAHGFEDHGTTTTPFEMLSLNHVSRYDLALDVARAEVKKQAATGNKSSANQLIQKYQNIIKENSAFAAAKGLDLIAL